MGLFRKKGGGRDDRGPDDEPAEGPPGRGGRSAAGGRPPAGKSKVKGVDEALLAYVRDFVATRKGVEAYVEPATRMAATTVVFIALDVEWTRRAVESGEAAGRIAHAVGIPVYDVNATGYPPAMREWTRRHREAEKARAIRAMVDRFYPGRSDLLRAPTAQEIKATRFVGMEIEQASANTFSN